jgi:hypothetical protein
MVTGAPDVAAGELFARVVTSLPAANQRRVRLPSNGAAGSSSTSKLSVGSVPSLLTADMVGKVNCVQRPPSAAWK